MLSAHLTDLLVTIVAAILAITLHEAAHAFAAKALGDDTAQRMGRLSLNPLRHVDRVGTILLPGALLAVQLLTLGRVAVMFGWAKPVPVNAGCFRYPRQGMALVAAAGPAMNFLLAWLAALATHATDAMSGEFAMTVGDFLDMFILTNLVLGLFNLLPIPPLDGGRIVVGLLPEGAARTWARLERAGIVMVLLFVFLIPLVLQQFGIAWNPVGDALGDVIPWAYQNVLWLAGHE